MYLSNYLETLMIQIKYLTNSGLSRDAFDESFMKIITEYNFVIQNQKKINHHFGRVFYFYHVYNFFTFIYPILILFSDFEKDFYFILFDLFNYLNIVFLVFLPVIIFNTYFTNSNTDFVKKCYSISKRIKNVKYRIKLMNVFSINPEIHSISFNFKHFMNYTLNFFIFVGIFSIFSLIEIE